MGWYSATISCFAELEYFNVQMIISPMEKKLWEEAMYKNIEPENLADLWFN